MLGGRRQFVAIISIVLSVVTTGLMCTAQGVAPGFALVRAVRYRPVVRAYASVEPAYVVTVSATEGGVLSGFTALPGSTVRAGAVLGHVQGPTLQLMLAQGEANVRGADAQLAAAQKSLAIVRQQLATHLSTNVMVHQAESALAQAQANDANAHSGLAAVRGMEAVIAPTSGTVLALAAADGEMVSAGQGLLTLQPAGKLWLRASIYGADINAVRVGMAGTFSSADGRAPVAVRVRSIFAALGANGAESVALVAAPGAAHATRWLNGEYGTVALRRPTETLLAVPTRSLILDQGRWWVLVKTARGFSRQAVVPGPARGWQTYVEQGLQAGQQVVASNAYLLFHQGVANSYQPPD